MTSPSLVLETLERHVAGIASASSPSEVFRCLLESSRLGAPRGAIFLHREDRWRGWGSMGHSAEAVSRQRGLVLAGDGGWLGRLGFDPHATSEPRPPGERGPDFGQAVFAEALGLPLRLGGRPVAVLVVERHANEEPWEPAALRLIVRVARLRLDLDMLGRRLRGAAAQRSSPKRAQAAALASGASSDVAPTVEPAPQIGLAPIEEPATESPDARRREEARRYARLVATDIRLYNEEAVVLGRHERDLARRLREPLTRGRELFLRRFPDLVDEGLGFLEEAYVQVLAGGDETLLAAEGDGVPPR